jgi:hypothetical protein
MTERELLQQALKELEGHETIFEERNINKVIQAMRTRLAELDGEWVGLTEEEIYEIYETAEEKIIKHWESGGTTMMFPLTVYKAFEAKLKEKNT